MGQTLWNYFSSEEQQEYIKFLKIFGALSGLFKDTNEGSNASKPYLYYRNHEQLFARVFDVEDLTRYDSAFDAVGNFNGQRIGIGLKTWIHTRDKTFQKVAEFNKLAPTVIRPLIANAEPLEVVRKVASLRNERIRLDCRTYKTTSEIYHNITRDNNVMNVIESTYDLVDLDSLRLLAVKDDKSVFDFEDKHKKYKFYVSKSVLLQEFDASPNCVITQIPIKQYSDPFELIEHIQLEGDISQPIDKKSVIYLPIYSDRTYLVEEKSGFNAWNAAPKVRGSDRLRPDFEAYIPIPVWIHHLFPNFFGFDALDKEVRNSSIGFKLHLPDGNSFDAIVTQDNGKSLQTNPQSILGKWILHDVLGLEARQLLTIDRLRLLGVDSLKITRIDNKNFKIDLADSYAFENWKLDLQSDIDNCSAIKHKPSFRPYLFE